MKDNKTARTLLIELLAHQFCFPVRWIETQNVILGDHRTERTVELGPANTLKNMAKRTIALQYASKDMAQNINRQLLAFRQDLNKISYDGEVVRPTPKLETKIAAESAEPAVKTTMATTSPAQVPSFTPPASTALALDDVPVSTVEIVSTIVAISLTKALTTVDMTKSIKALTGGRSALQNEIVGDLASEFDAVPDGVEELPLDALCHALQSGFAGKLGRTSRSIVEKLVSQKSPSNFPEDSMRKYLRQRWGLGKGRQDSVLLCAATTKPSSRLTGEDEAKMFLDGVVQAFMHKMGLNPPDTSVTANASSTEQATMSTAALELIENKQKAVWEEQIALYSSLLGLDVHGDDDTIASLRLRIAELDRELEDYRSEHGDAYTSGIRSIFTPLKVRFYKSWWNWAMQDLLILVASCAIFGLDPNEQIDLDRLRSNVVQRVHPRMVETLRYLISVTTRTDLAAFLCELLAECEQGVDQKAAVRQKTHSMSPSTQVEHNGRIVYREQFRSSSEESIKKDEQLLRLGRKGIDGWQYSENLSTALHLSLADLRTKGLSLSGRHILVTGAGSGSIGCELVAKLIEGGAHVVVTSSSFSTKTARFYQSLFANHGGKGAKLVLIPCNQASIRDIEALVKYIYDSKDGLNMDLDSIVPFAAVSETGRNLGNIDAKSELAHRVMLTNTLRMLGAVKEEKQNRGVLTRPAQVILPLSPNHGTFGGDGLYAESKLGLESLFEKSASEDWADYLLVCGALIGWTRGTGLMSDNDIVAEGMEKHGMRTYSRSEMAFMILSLMSERIMALCADQPLIADLSGGMGRVANLKSIATGIRYSINKLSEEKRAIANEASFETPTTQPSTEADMGQQANLELDFPVLPDYDTAIRPLTPKLDGIVDLDRVVVVTGFAEVGPWGNSRIRWDMELNGSLSLESYIELAWIMGLIEAYSGFVDGQPYAGWTDKETRKPISDEMVRTKYSKFMLEHCGIRYAEHEDDAPSWNGVDILHEIEISRDHPSINVSQQVSLQLKAAHGDKVQIFEDATTGAWKAILKKGARIMIPKHLATPHTVAGQIPKGWNASVYGIPDDVISQVDPVTLYGLVATAEAFQSAGIRDPYEFYRYVHVSDIANCIGSGLGGVASLRSIFKKRLLDEPAAKDVLAESFISSGTAWINLLLLSSAGANKTPVGACATAIESLDTAYDLIQAGKAKVCLVGGFDHLAKEISDEFANLRAAVNTDAEAASGREPSEMSRPATSTRKGFVESEGSGVQLVTTASLALEMGLPIQAIVALTRTAMDKAGRSIPAPGRGLLGAAMQKQTKFESPLMNLAYRKRALAARNRQIDEMHGLQLVQLEDELAELELRHTAQGLRAAETDAYYKQRLASIGQEIQRDRKDALDRYGNHFWKHDNTISPIQGSLAVWGLSVDDIDVVSFHGTSTKGNDHNESAIVNEHFRHLGRQPGNVVPVVMQKAITGHPKGPAGAWMLNGCMQIMRDGQIPGNGNADDIDDTLEQYAYLLFPSRPISRPEVRAFMLQSFGFGQKGALALGVNPKYLYATLTKDAFETYKQRLGARRRKASRSFYEGLAKNSIVQMKNSPPWAIEEEVGTLLDPDARFTTT